MDDKTTSYARSVSDGKTIAGQWVRLSCERHLEDLKTGKARGLKWRPEKAACAHQFFSLLRHSKGKWAGQAFELQPWQLFVVGSLFGWFKADGSRRFNVGHVEVARKNGKSTLASGVGLYLFVMDGEPGAEVYTTATKKEQASMTHEEAKRMVRASPDLQGLVNVYKNNLSIESTNSKFEPLSADGHKLDGLNVHGAIVDELHAWKNRLLWDVMETATGARRQPLFLVTTTAGYDRHSIWWERREAAIKCLTARNPDDAGWDDTLFSFVATPDEADDWRDEACWQKANPSLGVTVRVDELREKCSQAEASPGKQNPFKRLRLNMPTEQVDRWLDLAQWDLGAEPINLEELRGRPCFGGLDLARVRDLTAFALLFPPIGDGERWKLLVWFWCPEHDIRLRSERDRVPYEVWARRELITATEGNTTNFRFVAADIVKLAGLYDIREIAYDRTFAGEIIQTLMDEGLQMVEFGQGYLSMASPTAELERLLLAGQLQHGGNPILRWNAGNVAVSQDPAGNLKPDKKKSGEKIDGIVAAIMALGRAMVTPVGERPTVEAW